MPNRLQTYVLHLWLGLLIIWSGTGWADSASELITKGWEEYQFLSLDQAATYFEQALKANPDPKLEDQARIGLAMTYQFSESGRDIDRAEELYQEVMDRDPSPEIRDLILSNLADLHLAREEKEAAIQFLDELVNTRLDSVLGQDALRRRIHLEAGAYGSEVSRTVANEASQLLSSVSATPEDPKLLPILHDQLGNLYFWLEDYARAAEHFEKFTLLGNADTTSYGSQSKSLYRVAKIYEQKLDQPQRAAEFYRRLILEYPNSNMAYYALEKAAAAGTVSRAEIENLRLSGMTEADLDGLFAAGKGGRR
jgi:tetratricopeptide (TPR) repeat protein